MRKQKPIPIGRVVSQPDVRLHSVEKKYSDFSRVASFHFSAKCHRQGESS